MLDPVLRLIATPINRIRKRLRRGKPRFGAHAIALTPDRRIILVRLRYAPGWRIPGGGRKADEDPRDAALRELREEIGMAAHGRLRHARDLPLTEKQRRDCASLLIVDDVLYRPRRFSWEIEEVREFALDRLPGDLSPRMARWIATVREQL